jgi:uncharacterized protein (DUF39 family)
VDLFIGATNMSEKHDYDYGGGHVISDLFAGKEVEFRATVSAQIATPNRR